MYIEKQLGYTPEEKPSTSVTQKEHKNKMEENYIQRLWFAFGAQTLPLLWKTAESYHSVLGIRSQL